MVDEIINTLTKTMPLFTEQNHSRHAAWWASRVQFMGPHRERTDVVMVHICADTGLADVQLIF